ncbi:MAG: redoxin domain-containing protein [Bacteroidota bacterium]|nr:redoxin domain-containing protein [Bacteroidota bacterium]
MKKLLYFSFLLFSLQLKAQYVDPNSGPSHILRNGYHMEFKVDGFKGKKVYLCSIYGERIQPVDSAENHNGAFKFERKKKLSSGQYRVYLDTIDFFDIVFNQEDMEMHTHMDSLISAMKVLKSNENYCFYLYLKRTLPVDEMIGMISQYSDSSEQWKGETVEKLLVEKNVYTRELIFSCNRTLASRIIRSYITPTPSTYDMSERVKYNSRTEFLRVHFFDNIDFTDTLLLYTESVYNSVRYYMEYLMEKKDDSDYIITADYIMGMVGKNPQMYKYVLDLMVGQFENSRRDVPYAYISEKYLLGEGCSEGDARYQTVSEKIKTIKKTVLGAIAPDLELPNAKNNMIKLSEVKSPWLLVFFWSTHCKYCKRSVAELTSLYKTYNPKGFDIYAVNVDSSKQEWLNTLGIINNKWYHTWSPGKYNDAIKDYDVFVTPKMLLLDENKKIIYKPRNTAELKELLDTYLGGKTK